MIVVLAFLLALSSPVLADVRIARDEGGNVEDYYHSIEALRQSRELVRIDGYCFSACTMYVSLPNACATSNASLHFHAPYQEWWFGRRTNEAVKRWLMEYYPQKLREWILARGGLTPSHIVLRPPELWSILPRCIGARR